MSQLKIGITGVHGSGKTTLANKLEKEYSADGKRVHVVREVARRCTCKRGTIPCQEWIWEHQLAAEKHAMNLDVDVVICDRTVMDNLMYYLHLIFAQIGEIAGHDLLPPYILVYNRMVNRWCELYDEAVQWMPTYDRVIRMPLNLEWLKADDPIRPKDEKYAQRIDRLFDIYVQPYVNEPR